MRASSDGSTSAAVIDRDDPRRGPRVAVFRADGGSGVGFGHVARCAALAEHLTQLGWEAHLVSNLAASAPIRLDLFATVTAPPDSAAESMPSKCDLLVVDHYGLAEAFEHECRSWADRIAVIDDLADRRHDADMLIDSAGADRARHYAGLVGAQCEILAGPEYALLRKEVFASRRPSLLQRAGPVRRVLISLGSGDTHALTRECLRIAADAAPGCAVDVIGSYGDMPDSLRGRVTTYERTDKMIELAAKADLAIGAAGVGAWERCAMGVPSVAVVTAANQRHVATTLAEAGAAHVVGLDGRVDVAALSAAIRQAITDDEGRRAMARRALGLCDGLGAARVAAILDAPRTSQDGKPVRLRRATRGDESRMLAWQQHPRTRAHAKNPAAPSAQEHARWLAAKLDDPNCVLEIIMHGDEPAGVLRLDRIREAPDARLVSIYVAPEKYRRGIGGAALALARRLLPDSRFVAEVLPANTASAVLFRGAGYVWTGTHFESEPLANALAHR